MLRSRDRFAAYQRASATPETAAALLAEVYACDVRSQLADVSAPTLVIHRRDDRAMPFAGARELAAGLPDAELLALDGDAQAGLARRSRARARRAAHLPAQRVGTLPWHPRRPALLARADPAEPPARHAPEAEAAGLRRGDVLGPLLALERAPGRVRLRLVVPRRRDAGDARCPFGVVNAPGPALPPGDRRPGRGHAGELFPDRLWVALGTGEASNEHITGAPGRPSAMRNARLRECVDVMRALLAGEDVDHDGLVRVDRARLWTLPAEPPPLVGAAVSRGDRALVRRVGRRARDDPPAARAARARCRRVPRGRRGGQAGPPAGPPVVGAERGGGARASPTTSGARTSSRRRCAGTSQTVEQFDEAARHVRPEDVRGGVLVSADPRATPPGCASWPSSASTQIQLHHVGQDLAPFIDAFAEHVLPALRAMSAQGDQRRVVEERGRLLPRRRDVPRLRRRRLRRPRRACASGSTTSPASA